MGRTAHWSVSVIMEEAVLHPPGSVCVAQVTQERGARTSVRSARTVWAADRHVAV